MLVLMGMQFLNFLRKAAEMGIPPEALLPLVGLKVMRDFAPVLPLALFLAIIFSVGRLYRDSEAVVLNAAGIGEINLIRLIQPITLFVFLLVSAFSFYLMPWSKTLSEQMMQRINQSKHLSLIKAGHFQEFSNGSYMFYASKISSDRQHMTGIFSQLMAGNRTVIIVADSAKQYTDTQTQDVYLELQNGSRYYGFDAADTRHSATRFDTYYIRIYEHNSSELTAQTEQDPIRALPTSALLFADDPAQTAELHWRIAQPLSVLLLAALAVFLARSSPRSSRSKGLLLGLFVFVIYNNLLILVRTWLADGDIEGVWGMWWVHLMLLLYIYSIYVYRHRRWL